MPSLIRFLFTIGVLAGIVYAGMWALVFYVDPTPREMQVRIPANRINPDF
ncbi:histidine kinase [Oricola thermophila]|uniref:Histidine kinase n=1 Tax=Oricola thermophila TaxID=2742145 RepID=A0A6N1VGW8_9HYPH|nr:histidine kinase [Oricola thermophila]QKV20150.1 histidine kinase [Oricola thermophila]